MSANPVVLNAPAPAPVPMPPPRLTSYRYWEGYRTDDLREIRSKLDIVLDDRTRQLDMFDAPEAPPLLAAPATIKNETLGTTLSPSQVNTYLGCSARWWFKYGLRLPDPAGGSLVRGKVVHRIVEYWMRRRQEGNPVDVELLQDFFEAVWDEESDGAAFGKDEDPEELKRQAASLSRLVICDAAADWQFTDREKRVSGEIAGVPVIGFIDHLLEDGTILDLKTAAKSPSGIGPDYALQLATYRQLEPRSNGKARLVTAVCTKTPKLVTIDYTVSVADQLHTQHIYPLVREGIREGLYFPNRNNNLCSRRYCAFADACEREFGGRVE